MTSDASVMAIPAMDAGGVDPAVGTWYGDIEDAIARASTACVILNQVGMVGPAGDTRYTGAFQCTGMISYIETIDGAHSFQETATGGAGCPSGNLRLTPLSDGTLRFNFYWNEGSLPESDGILKRVDACP
jgi:hypothetical protein